MQIVHNASQTGFVAFWTSRPFAIVALVGSAYLAVLCWFAQGLYPDPFFGGAIYDGYYHAILNGHFDLPPRLLRFEGHYTPDAQGYLYHGAGPLLLRFLFGWAWPFESIPMAGFSIWFWTALGTLGYQVALKDLIAQTATPVQRNAQGWAVFFAAALWVCGPATLLVVNQSLYHEPIALAYGAAGAFVAVWVRFSKDKLHPLLAFSVLALCAAITVHARPNLAIGLYVALIALCGWSVIKHGVRMLLPALVAGAILAAGGLLYLGLNTLRFGGAAEVHGSFEASETQYGTVFWGIEPQESPRAQAFTEHGRFNVQRIPPNAGLYAFDLPALELTHRPSMAIYNLFQKATQERLGYIRVEGPRYGLLWLWPIWLSFAVVGLVQLRRAEHLVLAAGLLVGVLVTLSYGTITLRYRFDLWPLVAFLSFLGISRVLPGFSNRHQPGIFKRLVFAAALMGTTVTAMASFPYTALFREIEGSFFAPWSNGYCTNLAEGAGLPSNQMSVICRAPTELKG